MDPPMSLMATRRWLGSAAPARREEQSVTFAEVRAAGELQQVVGERIAAAACLQG